MAHRLARVMAKAGFSSRWGSPEVTEIAPGYLPKKGVMWWKLRGEAVSVPDLLPSRTAAYLAEILRRVLVPNRGWICGFTRVWGPVACRTPYRSLEGFEFAVIWPKFL